MKKKNVVLRLTVTAGVALAIFWTASASSGAFQQAVELETKERVLEAIETYVERDVRVKDGFLILDPRTKAPIRLAFDYVHDGVKEHELGHVACVDFKDAQGSVYDVDVVVKSQSGSTAIEKVFVHKVDGELVTRE